MIQRNHNRLPNIISIIELRINKGTFHFLPMGRGDFSRPDFRRLKPPLPQKDSPKRSFITFAKLNIMQKKCSRLPEISESEE
jgi:hypothetical protein